MGEPIYRALLLGNACFDDPDVKDLHGPRCDLPLLAQELTREDTGLFRKANVTCRLDLSQREMSLQITSFASAAYGEDLLLLYYSGHGLRSDEGGLSLFARDTWKGDLLATGVRASTIRTAIERSPARAKVLILDCCYAGAFKDVEDEMPEYLRGRGLFWLFSSGPTERSKAAAAAGEPSPFTAGLVEALQLGGLDEDRDDFIRFEDVYFYLDKRFREWDQPAPVRMLPGPTWGTVALARAHGADGTAGEQAPTAPPPAAPNRLSAACARPASADSVIIPDLGPRLALLPPERPRFALSQFLVTNRQFFAFLDDPDNVGWRRHGRDALRHADERYLEHWLDGRLPIDLSLHPVVNVSVAAAEAYTRWLGRRLGRTLRLPTVDEWRLAAHAGRADPDWLKDDLERGRVNYRRTEWELSAVGEFAANPYGIADLLGNAHDACRLGAGDRVVGCGGAFWATKAQLQEVLPLDDFECRRDVGFRCAGDLTPADDEPTPGARR